MDRTSQPSLAYGYGTQTSVSIQQGTTGTADGLQTSVSIQQETTGTADGLQTSVSIQQGTTADHTEGGVMGSMGVALLSPERIWTILVFTLVACIGSTLTGAIGGYSTNTISNLESNPGRYGIDTSDFRKDTFSVSDIYSVQVSAHVIIWLITRGMCMDVYNHACI